MVTTIGAQHRLVRRQVPMGCILELIQPYSKMIGKLIGGRYHIIQNLGSGGFGQTFLAEDCQLPARAQCVVKLLKPATSDVAVVKTASRLFENEAKILHQLGTHDRIPRLLAHFEEDSEFYLVQELIEGNDLTHEFVSHYRDAEGYQLGCFNEVQTIAFLLEILEILSFVHDHGAIHRDIKPANLMRRRSDGKLILIDFGAVKQIGTALGHQPLSTVAIGTDGYMPNEQAIGKPRPCSDLYAVGIIAIQGLTGVQPHLLAENMETGELAWRMSPKHMNFKYRAVVSDGLAKIIDGLVRYDFRDRYQTASAALWDLQNLCQDMPAFTNVVNLMAAASAQRSPSPQIQNIPLNNQRNHKQQPTNPLSFTTLISRLTANFAVGRHPKTNIPVTIQQLDGSKSDANQFANQFANKYKLWHFLAQYFRKYRYGIVGILIMLAIAGSFYWRTSKGLPPSLASISTIKYIFLSERTVTTADLANKNSFEIDIMASEILARYGSRFNNPELQAYFDRQPWYQPRYAPNEFSVDLLTPTELDNVRYILNYQKDQFKKTALSTEINPQISPKIAISGSQDWQSLPNRSESKCDYAKRLISDPQPPINVREGAGTSYRIIGSLHNGIQITVVSEQQGWLRISEPLAGWVAANRTKPICF
ncbi:YARHG domain-containing protein [Pseudanabaena sp. FACHB-1277]|uniref:non-specific serine/threonine protein kinase n=1 Tax=Pseudanabaena cinerea FACHB-1277 TaxID=2949581 RepID=A0A926URZ2_9CYAN|nr:YARHG domain-containing protein [Pseudanabaena cinerea]MBD2149798.1 YARHG domain-containing protein [Pseudanabaena cinerea FACHB-1277]